MARKKEIPEIGDRENGRTLVAMGDDFPDRWIPWLDDQVGRYGDVVSLLEEAGLSVDGLSSPDSSTCKREFAEALGVEFSSSSWESDHIGGHFQMGWINSKAISEAKKAGKALLKNRLASIKAGLVKMEKSKLEGLDIEELVERITHDPRDLQAEIDSLRKAKQFSAASHQTALGAQDQASKVLPAVSEASRECIDFAVSMSTNGDSPIVAGPIAAWRDEVFCIVSQGGVRPPASPYDDLLDRLRNTPLKIVEVHDETIVGRTPLSGKDVFLKGSSQLADWKNVWRVRTPVRRVLRADSPENSQKAMDLYEILRGQ